MSLSIDGMRIKCAAIRYQGVNYEGESHSKIGEQMLADGECQRPYPSGEAQGFVTECGKFVRREVALIIAKNAGQVTQTSHPRMLFSEDLKNNEESS